MIMNSLQTREGLLPKIIGGIVGGLVGGIAFGLMMAVMGMLPMIAGLVGSSSPLVGFLVHMVISAMIGIGFGLLCAGQVMNVVQGVIWGLGYGLVWWVLGPMILMPLMMGMGLQVSAAFTSPMLMSLVGHLVYGVLVGATCAWYLYGRA